MRTFGAARGLHVDHRVADEDRRARVASAGVDQVLEPRGVGLSRESRVTADEARDMRRQLKRIEQPPRRHFWLVRQDAQPRMAGQTLHHFRHAGIRPGVQQKAPIVDGSKPRERVVHIRFEPRRRQCPDHESPRALAHHACHGVEGQRAPAVRLEHLVGALREIPLRVDERAVEIEDDQQRTGPRRLEDSHTAGEVCRGAVAGLTRLGLFLARRLKERT